CASRPPPPVPGSTGSRAGCGRSSSPPMRFATMDPDDLREAIRTALDRRLVESPGLESRVLAALSDPPGRAGGLAPPWPRHAGLTAVLLAVVLAGSLTLWWRALPHAPAGPGPQRAAVQLAQFTSGSTGWVIGSRFTGLVPDFVTTVDRTDDGGA